MREQHVHTVRTRVLFLASLLAPFRFGGITSTDTEINTKNDYLRKYCPLLRLAMSFFANIQKSVHKSRLLLHMYPQMRVNK